MKTFCLILFAITINSCSFSQYGQIPNGSFENWLPDFIYENPNQWKSSNTDQFNGIANIIKSSDANSGSFSARLGANASATDTTTSYLYLGQIGMSGPEAGISYADNFEAVNISFKSDLQIGDTLNFFMIRYLGGLAVEYQSKPVTFGTNSTWSSQIIFVGNQPQDSLFIGFILGDVNGAYSPQPSSWALVDDIQLLSGGATTTPLPNNGFETWNNTTVENPSDWFTINYLLNAVNSENVVKTTDANSGTFATQLTTILIGADTIAGFLSLGAIDFNNTTTPFASTTYSATPTTIAGTYKYSPSGGDVGYLQIIFYQGGIPIGTHFETFTVQTSYTNFSSPLTIIGSPDSLLFIAFSGDNPGSVLKIDDLMFSGGNVSVDELLSIDFDIYPNPVSNNVSIKLPSNATHSMTIKDLSGRIIYIDHDLSGIQSVDLSNFDKGTYIVTVNNTHINEIKKLIIQ